MTLAPESYDLLNSLMRGMPPEWRTRWCTGGLCACLGCANHGVLAAGFTKADWEEWIKRNDAAGERQEGK